MPKLPTMRAREAETKLARLLDDRTSDSTAPLPPVRQLGEQLGISYATVARLLQRFAQEGRAWKHPNGRFFPGHASHLAEGLPIGLPIVVLGRQIQNWFRLYQAIIEGVSEVCTTRGCPLVFLSSDKLVRHKSPETFPVFTSLAIQETELQRLTSSMPRRCAGLLFDYLWDEKLIATTPFPSAPRLLLARPSCRGDVLSITPDFQAGAHLLFQQLSQRGCKRVYLGVPFVGDQAVDASGEALRQAAASGLYPAKKIEVLDCSTPPRRRATISRLARLTTRAAVICTDDNVTSLLWQGLIDAGLQGSKNIELLSMQGTGAFDLPITHLRYDYRQLGRDAVMAVLERCRSDLIIPPRLISQRTH